MKRASILLVFLLLWASLGLAAEKVKFGISSSSARYLMPPTLALDKGLWKEKGLDVEIISFRGGGPTYRAVAARELKLGMVSAGSFIPAVARGLPGIMVAQMMSEPDFLIWVKGDSPIQQPRDLKGAKIGVSRIASATHIYATVVVRALGIEKDVKIVAAGGLRESMAALKVGIVQAMMETILNLIELEARGEVRMVAALKDYVPRPWMEVISLAERTFAQEKPEATKMAITGLLEATEYIKANQGPVVAKMRTQYGYSEEVARRAYGHLQYTKGGKIDTQALANVKEFLIAYGLVKKEEAPALNDLYTRAFTE